MNVSLHKNSIEQRYLTPNWPAPTNVKALMTTRCGGLSRGIWASFNLGTRSGDNLSHVLKNRETLQSDWQLHGIQWLKQVHGNTLVEARITDNEPDADASWTDKHKLACLVLTGDCLPVLFSNQSGSRVAAAHAGWRGLSKDILKQTLNIFQDSPSDILVWLGAAISAEAYEVSSDVRDAFLEFNIQLDVFFKPINISDKWLANLKGIAIFQLNALGINNIYQDNYCSYKQKDLFFSRRRDGAKSGRMASLIWIE